MPCNCPTSGGAQHYTISSALDDDDNQTQSTWSPPMAPSTVVATPDPPPLVVIKRGTTIASTVPTEPIVFLPRGDKGPPPSSDEEAPFPWLALAIGVTGVFMFAGKRRR